MDPNFLIFSISALVIAFVGTKLISYAEKLAHVTGLGNALFGGIFLGFVTSLSGSITSISAAWQGYANLAISNALGGIAAQTVFLAIADLSYRRANLEHAAASVSNLMQGTLLITLLSLPLLALMLPQLTIGHIHFFTILLICFYIFGLKLCQKANLNPMWLPRRTRETFEDKWEKKQRKKRSELFKLWTGFILLSVAVGLAGFFIAESGIQISKNLGLSETIVGSLFTAITTSTPELVTALIAVKRGSLNLAVGDIIGGNCFDVLFIAFSDIFYFEGSIFSQLGSSAVYLIALGILMTGILLLGLLKRDEHGIGNIGFESMALLIIYSFSMIFLVYLM